MAVHDRFVSLAQRLIAKHGDTVVLRKLSRTPADAAKPWRGPSTETLAAEVEVIGVMVDYDAEEIDGEQVKVTDRRLLIAAASVVGQDLSTFDIAVVDGDQVYSIVKVVLIKPGATRILYDLQVRQ